MRVFVLVYISLIAVGLVYIYLTAHQFFMSYLIPKFDSFLNICTQLYGLKYFLSNANDFQMELFDP